MKLFSRPILMLAAVAVFGAAALTLRPQDARAHPLGNFTINHSTTIEISESGIAVFRVLEYAEIPAFQELQNLPTDADGFVVLDSWAAEEAVVLRKGMRLTLDGDDVALTAQKAEPEILEGEGGLPLLRVEVTYAGDIPGDWKDASRRLGYTDSAYADKIGWREVIARGGPGVELVDSTFPAETTTQYLRTYPEDVASSPPDVREASLSFKPGVGMPSILGAEPADPDHETAAKGNPDSTLGGFTDLIAEKELSVGFVIVALLTATVFGAIHALSPGHGKTVVAAYLVGSRGTLRQAALLALVVTATHTSSVYLLGFVTLYLSEYVVPEDLYPWMSLIAGGIILVMGLSLLFTRLGAAGAFSAARKRVTSALRRRGPALAFASEDGSLAPWTTHAHGSVQHEHMAVTAGTPEHHHHDDIAEAPHDHEHVHEHDDDGGSHSHGFGPAHSHTILGADGEPVTWQRLVGLGIFGGMIPCPSAIVVMLSAIALHRVGLGLVLIVAFSFGLAAVLTGIGFLVVYAQRSDFLRRAMDRAESSGGLATTMVRLVPIFAAVLVTAAGLFITVRAAGQF